MELDIGVSMETVAWWWGWGDPAEWLRRVELGTALEYNG